MPVPPQFRTPYDARDHALAMAAHAKGADPRLTEAEMDEYLATPAGGISQPYLVQLETGRRRSADIVVYARLAKRLAVQVEHLITPDE